MGTITIDGRKIEFTNERNILTIIRKAGIDVPTLCYQDDLSTFGECRLCTVEDDKGKLFASCSEEPRDGMVIYTNTGKLRKYRKLIIELMLAAHCRDCNTCQKNGECTLQTLARRYNITDVRFNDYREPMEPDFSSPSIIRDPAKCVLCGNCVRVCEELQGIGAINFAQRGSDACVTPAFDKKIAETDCVNCGQCRVYCPTGAITIRHNRTEVWEALADPNVRVIAQVAPAVRVAVGDAFGLGKGKSVMGKIVAVLHRMGFDEVYDTTFSADLTIMEETQEFLDRVANGGKLPLLTSCCPAWVKFVGDHFPDYVDNVSTCRSPQGMLSAVTKEYFRDPANNPDGRKTVMVSIMPCTAKKMEANRPNSYTKGEKDTDYVITTTELIDMIRTYGVRFDTIEPEASDIPFGFGSGGGVIFGVTGGVTEAVIRRLVPGHDKETLEQIADCGVREEGYIREFTVPYNGIDVKICVASGLANARKVMEDVRSGAKEYHLIEIMACRGGCVMGGGQPRILTDLHDSVREVRTHGIYRADSNAVVKKSDENPMLQSLYEGFLKGKEHELLHNHEFCGK
ncbi:MAG: [FeFe] hydrogenase, group A [Lachnospiraceae bacterium]|nr:[FeFe] hydrogenase, group A [Lachnospiraceae bacterium]